MPSVPCQSLCLHLCRDAPQASVGIPLVSDASCPLQVPIVEQDKAGGTVGGQHSLEGVHLQGDIVTMSP